MTISLMTISSTTVTPTTAYLGNTVTLTAEVSETIPISHLAMWIIDFDETTDSSTTIFELINQGRVITNEWSAFAQKTSMSSEVQIDESMLEAHTLTFILAQGGSTGISISDSPELFTIGDPINVSFKLHLYDKVKKLGNQWFYLKDEVNTLLSAKENNANKVTNLSNSSTDTQYPSAKAVYNAIENTFNLDTLDCINENFTILSLPQIILTYNENSFNGSSAYILSRYNESAYVDWGDGTPIETYDKNHILEHEYSDNIQEHTIIIYGNIYNGSLYYASFRGLSGITSINIPSAVHSMESNIFLDCTGLTSVNLPQELTNIGSNTFKNCINLNTIILNWTELPPITYSRLIVDSLSTMNSTFSISIPYGTTSLYEDEGYPSEKLIERSE